MGMVKRCQCRYHPESLHHNSQPTDDRGCFILIRKQQLVTRKRAQPNNSWLILLSNTCWGWVRLTIEPRKNNHLSVGKAIQQSTLDSESRGYRPMCLICIMVILRKAQQVKNLKGELVTAHNGFPLPVLPGRTKWREGAGVSYEPMPAHASEAIFCLILFGRSQQTNSIHAQLTHLQKGSLPLGCCWRWWNPLRKWASHSAP